MQEYIRLAEFILGRLTTSSIPRMHESLWKGAHEQFGPGLDIVMKFHNTRLSKICFGLAISTTGGLHPHTFLVYKKRPFKTMSEHTLYKFRILGRRRGAEKMTFSDSESVKFQNFSLFCKML